MEKLDNLALNKKEMDTGMAQEYIRNYKEPEWLNQGTRNDTQSEKNSDQVDAYKLKVMHEDQYERIIIGKRLATKIEENAEMFAQLEYLARGTDSRDVKDGHIKIISQYLRCCNALWNPSSGGYSLLQVTEDTPLFHLASIAGHLHRNKCADYFLTVIHQSMKHICQYFIGLCHEVGFNIEIIKGFEPHPSKTISFTPDRGCTGVVTEWSDLDSALDAFIQSSQTAPWRLEQIYVQESIFENFKNALMARAQPADGIVAGGKTFLFESLQKAAGIPVDAYRTTKELLSLLRSPFLSLWAAESALANEVALHGPATTVWVNDYACFDGPPRAALSVLHSPCGGLTSLLDVRMASNMKLWSKMTACQRLEVIVSAVEASGSGDVRALIPALTQHWRSDHLLHVTNTSLCFGVQEQMGVVLSDHLSEAQLLVAIKALVNGNAVIVSEVSTVEPFVHELSERGVPIAHRDLPPTSTYPQVMEKLKVIRTNHGTIFAN